MRIWQLKMNMLVRFQSEPNNCVTSYKTENSPGMERKGCIEGMVVLEEELVVGEGREKERRECHWSEEGGGGCFCSAWQVELSDAAGWLVHMSLLFPQAQRWGAGEYGGTLWMIMCVCVCKKERKWKYISVWKRKKSERSEWVCLCVCEWVWERLHEIECVMRENCAIHYFLTGQ